MNIFCVPNHSIANSLHQLGILFHRKWIVQCSQATTRRAAQTLNVFKDVSKAKLMWLLSRARKCHSGAERNSVSESNYPVLNSGCFPSPGTRESTLLKLDLCGGYAHASQRSFGWRTVACMNYHLGCLVKICYGGRGHVGDFLSKGDFHFSSMTFMLGTYFRAYYALIKLGGWST